VTRNDVESSVSTSPRHCERSEAIQGNEESWIASSQELLAMTLRVLRQPLRVIASAAKQSRATKKAGLLRRKGSSQ
jgi:hypothetical protein